LKSNQINKNRVKAKLTDIMAHLIPSRDAMILYDNCKASGMNVPQTVCQNCSSAQKMHVQREHSGAVTQPLFPSTSSKHQLTYFTACACVWARVAFSIQHATLMRHTVLLYVTCLAPPYFLTPHDFRKKVIELKMCVLILNNFYLKIFSF
jgi:hypothetical protein